MDITIDLTHLESPVFDMELTPACLLAVQKATYQAAKVAAPTVLVTAKQRDHLLAALRETCGWEPHSASNPIWNAIRIQTAVPEPAAA